MMLIFYVPDSYCLAEIFDQSTELYGHLLYQRSLLEWSLAWSLYRVVKDAANMSK